MKQLMMIFLSLILVSSGFNSAKAGEDNDKYAYVTLKVNMDCGNCAEKVTTQLSYTKGVKDVKADYVKDEVVVKYLKKKCSAKDLIASLAEIDYKATVKGEKAEGCSHSKACSGSGTEHKSCGSGSGCGGSH